MKWFCLVLLCSVVLVVAAPKKSGSKRKKDRQPDLVVVDGGQKPSNSLYDHIMGNLKKSNEFVRLSALPHGIPPPAEDDYDEKPPVPIFNYAFINPELNGEKMPHWTDTLEKFKNNPVISPEVKEKVVVALKNPIKIYGDGTESKFPLLIEYFVQRVQNYFSHYVYEDMSRPASWDVKPNASDNTKPSSEKEPITEDYVKGDLIINGMFTTPNSSLEQDEDIDYILDITLRPDIEDLDPGLTDEDFDKTTEEWEAANGGDNSTSTAKYDAETVIVKETLDLKVIPPIGVEDDAFLYVGDGTGEELMTRSNKRKKLKKKRRN